MSILPLLVVCLSCVSVVAGQSPRRELAAAIEEILDTCLGRDEHGFALHVRGRTTRVIDITAPRVAELARQEARIELSFFRTGASTFAVVGRSPWADFELRRTDEETVLLLPKVGVAFRGRGEVGDDHLGVDGFVRRLLGKKTGVVDLARAFVLGKARTLQAAKGGPGLFRIDAQTTVRRAPGTRPGLLVQSTEEIAAGVRSLSVQLDPEPGPLAPLALDGLKLEEVGRRALETMVFRALRRALQTYVPVLRPSTRLRARTVEHGELRIAEGQRLAILHGTPEQMGHAHGQLLGDLVRQTVDSTFYLVGMVETVRLGKWFPSVLAGAWRRLSPHIPKRHLDELDALADAVPGLSRRELRWSSVFPEYFHCSGFAVFGSATKDGKLYHGRVLDYMTMIGLQHAAVTFVVKPDRGYAFLNVGYAGFIGSVTGMNERQISLGEMGGRGRLKWDGVPMATLMRRALEECGTLAEVKKLWRESPRTCEYFYVFADGKPREGRRAVGVAATPERIEFLDPGDNHPRLGPGIIDTVVLSAGKRLELLKKRIETHHGKIDLDTAIHLMDRPVAMRSNLHNALMIPEDGEVWIAHAGQDTPAAQMRYVRHRFGALLAELPRERRLHVRDTLPKLHDEFAGVAVMLNDFAYEPTTFEVRLRERVKGDGGAGHAIVTFPSPRPPKAAPRDEVVLEWYRANPRRSGKTTPAVLVLHILDGRMRVARGVARVLANNGFHAFVMHMPGYGQRKRGRPRARNLVPRSQQAVADARRARDAIAALPGVDPASISIQGTSLGGFVAALASAVDGCFRNTFLVLAGGDLPDMFDKGEKDIAKLRRAFERDGITRTQMRDSLATIDPGRVAHRLCAARTWMYSARSDRVVPKANAEALGAAAGLAADHHLWFVGNHYTCAVHVPAILAHMVEQMR